MIIVRTYGFSLTAGGEAEEFGQGVRLEGAQQVGDVEKTSGE